MPCNPACSHAAICRVGVLLVLPFTRASTAATASDLCVGVHVVLATTGNAGASTSFNRTCEPSARAALVEVAVGRGRTVRAFICKLSFPYEVLNSQSLRLRLLRCEVR